MASRTALLIPSLAIALASSFLSSRVALADLAPPPDPCDGKAKGDPCDSGVCVAETCSKLDYSKGTPPSSMEYECIKCRAKPADEAKPAAVTPTAAPVTPAPASTPKSAPAPKSGGCSIAGDGGGLSLALLLVLGVGYRRSRRAS
jgi:hypothetical protein